MDNKLIDEQILALLRIPAEQRTQKTITNALQRITEVAADSTPFQTGGTLDYTDIILVQREQLKLCAIGEFLMEELGCTWCSVTNRSDASTENRYATLSIILTSDEDHFLIGSGKTAELALRDLHEVKPITPRTTA